MIVNWAFWIYAALMVLGLGVLASKHGTSEETVYKPGEAFAALVIQTFLFWKMGYYTIWPGEVKFIIVLAIVRLLLPVELMIQLGIYLKRHGQPLTKKYNFTRGLISVILTAVVFALSYILTV